MLDVSMLPLIARLKTYPAFFLPVARLRTNAKREVVRRQSDIVIEGFWRCGNHFATYAFMVAQKQRLDVAHHFHAPAQLMLAVRWGVPAILVIRDPIDAVASATIYYERDDPGLWLDLYSTFHAPLVRYADKLVVSDFPRTVGDFGSVIAAVNARYGRDFALFEGTPQQHEQVERMIRGEHRQNMGSRAERLPLPSQDKAMAKVRILERMRCTEYAPRLQKAQQIYETLKKQSV